MSIASDAKLRELLVTMREWDKRLRELEVLVKQLKETALKEPQLKRNSRDRLAETFDV